MIRVVRAGIGDLVADAFVRPVGADLEACSAAGNVLGGIAGPEVAARLESFGGLDVGGAIVTPAGGLSAQFLIHIVIRSNDEPVSEDRVARGFRNGLRQAADWGVERLAVPPLGTGPGNLETDVSAHVMLRVLEEHRRELELPLEVVIAVGGEYEAEVFERVLARAAPGPAS